MELMLADLVKKLLNIPTLTAGNPIEDVIDPLAYAAADELVRLQSLAARAEALLDHAHSVLGPQFSALADDILQWQDDFHSKRPGRCPHPLKDDDGTTEMCVIRGHCGCDARLLRT
jgi:hypothetical protein